MSFTEFYRPKKIMPAFNMMGISFSSTNQTENKFEMIFDIFSASTSTRLDRVSAVVDPNGYCKADIQSIMKNYLKNDFNPTSTGITAANNSIVNYDLQIGEKYVYEWEFYDNFFYTGSKVGFSSVTSQHFFEIGDRVFIEQDPGYLYEQYNGVHTVIAKPSATSFVVDITFSATPANPGKVVYADGRATTFSGLTAISGLSANNSAFSHLDWIDFSSSNYNVTGGTAAKFFTDAPQEFEQGVNSRSWINFFSSSATTIKNLICTTYDRSNAVVGTYSKDLSSSLSLTKNYYKVGVGPWNLEANFMSASGASSLPVIQASVEKYEVWLEDASGNILTEKKSFKIDNKASRFDNNISICFLDRKGSYITREFQLNRFESEENEKSEFSKPVGQFNTNNFTYNSYDSSRVVYSSGVKSKHTAISNWIAEDDAEFLRQLFSSPSVYWNKDGTYIPIIITNKFYKIPSRRIDKIFNITIDFELGFKNPINI